MEHVESSPRPGLVGCSVGASERQPPLQYRVLRERAGSTATVASVCTGAFLLGRAGLLDGRRATTHSAAREALRTEFPATEVVVAKVVDKGAIATAAGVSSGIDLDCTSSNAGLGPQSEHAQRKVSTDRGDSGAISRSIVMSTPCPRPVERSCQSTRLVNMRTLAAMKTLEPLVLPWRGHRLRVRHDDRHASISGP
jgi:hypothetical protein